MCMKKFLVTILFVPFLALVGCNEGSKLTSGADLKTDEDKTFYSLGYMLGGNVKDFSFSEKEMGLVMSGFTDGAAGTKGQVEVADYQNKIREVFEERMKKQSSVMEKEGMDYLETFSKEEGVQKTESGLAYKILEEGKGSSPKETDMVEVHYHGTLVDGTVFDSSKERGQTAKFPLNGVIKGWTEGLQKVKEGGKIKLVIPSALGYGVHGAPPKIPGGATLVFEVELIKILEKKK